VAESHPIAHGSLAGIASSCVVAEGGKLWRIRPILSRGETPILFFLMGPLENGLTNFKNARICTGPGISSLDAAREA